MRAPESAEHLEGGIGQRHVAVFFALAVDVQQQSVSVDSGDLEVGPLDLGEPRQWHILTAIQTVGMERSKNPCAHPVSLAGPMRGGEFGYRPRISQGRRNSRRSPNYANREGTGCETGGGQGFLRIAVSVSESEHMVMPQSRGRGTSFSLSRAVFGWRPDRLEAYPTRLDRLLPPRLRHYAYPESSVDATVSLTYLLSGEG
jgi:hypothetical protein